MALSDYEKRGSGEFATVATLAQPLAYFTDLLVVSNIVYDEGASDVYVGMAVMINEEVLRVDEIIEPGASFRVARGCADTRPWTHSVGADVWFFEDATGTDARIYAGGEEIGVKALPWTHSGGVLPIADSPPEALTFNWRFSRPYVPGRMTHGTDEAPWFSGADFGYDKGGLVLRWAHRDRVLQADQLIDHFEGNIGPEPGSTYKAVIRNSNGDVLRTEVGLSGTEWVYPWAQAMGDFGLVVGGTGVANGTLDFMSYREGLDSWQHYSISFSLDTEGPTVQVAMYGAQTAMTPPGPGEGGERPPLMRAANVAMVGEQVAQKTDAGNLPTGLTIAAYLETVTPADALFAPVNRVWFEAPYTYLLRKFGMAPYSAKILSAAARPSDRIVDSHAIWSRLRQEPAADYVRKDLPPWCPWVTISSPLAYLQEDLVFAKSSLHDGVPVDGVRAGMMALIGNEIVIVREFNQSTRAVKIGRGSVDTVPANHAAGSRIWFFEAACGTDDGPFPDPAGNDDRVPVDLKLVPRGYGQYETALATVPTDLLRLSLRKQRPFPPGRLTVNRAPWFQGATAEPGRRITFEFTQRNRLTQRNNLLDHGAPSVPHEVGTVYLFSITTFRTRDDGEIETVVIRADTVVGERYDYTWEMALRDGYRLAAITNICGRVRTVMTVDAVRDGLKNWQGYGVSLVLPAPPCPPGTSPGGFAPLPPLPGGPTGPGGPGGGAGGYPGGGSGSGGTGGSGGSGGSGNNGSNNDSPGSGGNDGPPRPEDPFDNGSGGNGDSGYPGNEKPPGEDGDDEGMYWDYTWDIFWASRKRGGDDIGE